MKTKAATHGKGEKGRSTVLRRRLLPVLIAGCFAPGAALANPGGQQVVSGQASFNQQGSVLTVTNSPGAIINWQNFSINSGETTRFVQQSADSAVLNRVVGQDPSQILGTLQSNGRVFLINPNGILFGQGATVDVNGLVASTLNISNDDFLAGRMKFEGGGSGNLKNEGAITTPNGGQVYLIAPNVENSGIITAPNGDVLLAAGHTVHLVDSANPALQVVLSAPEHEALNIGQIIAQGGQASVYGALIKQRGIVSANSAVVGENGKIYFRASREINLDAGSTTSANGPTGGSVRLHSDDITIVKGRIEALGQDGKGGNVELLGDKVGVMDAAVVDASGKAGGGQVLVGGDYLGQGSVPNAAVTYTGEQATIRADATGNGDGGRVIVWADDTTRSYAHISVRGGDEGGDGGFVETSGKRYLDVGNAYPDVSAPKGKAGTWLLDPDNLSISVSTDSNVTAGSPFDHASTGDSVLNVDTLKTYLENNGTAVVQTGGNLTVDATIAPSMPNGGSLKLRAAGDLVINQEITTTAGAMNISMEADTNNDGTGSLNIFNIIRSHGGEIYGRGANVHLGYNGSTYGALDSGNGGINLEVTSAVGSFQMGAGTGTAGRLLRVSADTMTLDGNITNFGDHETGGGVYLNSRTAVRAITLGTKTAGTLGLSATELQALQTNYLRIGEPSNTGGITVNAPISFGSTSVNTLWLASSGQINIASSLSKSPSTSHTQLDMHSNGNVTRVAANGIITGWEEVDFNSGTNGSAILDSGAQVSAGEVEFNVDNLSLNGSVAAALVDIRSYTTGRGITVGSTTCHSSMPGCLTVTNLSRIDAHTIGIGDHDDESPTFASTAGPIHVVGITSGTGNMSTDRHVNTQRIGLLSGGNVTQSGAIQVHELGVVSGGNVLLDNSGNAVNGLVGMTNGGSFGFRNSQSLVVTSIVEDDDVYEGIKTGGGAVSLATTAGDLYINFDVDAGSGNVTLDSAAAVVGGWVIGDALAVSAKDGIDLSTDVNKITAVNTDTAGTSEIYIDNDGAVSLQGLRQAGNSGDILFYTYDLNNSATANISVAGNIDAGSGIVSLGAEGAIVGAGGTVRGSALGAYAERGISLTTQVSMLGVSNYDTATSSNISITNTGPLEVHHAVQSAGGGGISLTNYGAMKVIAYAASPSAPAILTQSGSINLTANSPLTVDGVIQSTSGAINLLANPSASGNDNLTINGTVSSAGNILLAAGGTVTINGTVSGPYAVQQYIGTTSAVDSAINTVISTSSTSTSTLSTTTSTTTMTSTSSTSSTSETTQTAEAESDGSESTDATEEEGSDTTAENETGASENEPAQKMYCN